MQRQKEKEIFCDFIECGVATKKKQIKKDTQNQTQAKSNTTRQAT